MESSVNYDAPASVGFYEDRAKRDMPSGGRYTLAGAVRYVKSLPLDQQARADIYVGNEAGLGKTVLDLGEINKLYARPDFPAG